MILWILLALLVLALVALVVDRRLHQARLERESRELERLIEQRTAQRKFDSELALRSRAVNAERNPRAAAHRPTSGTTHHYTHHTDTPAARCSGSSSDNSSCDSSSGGGE